MSVETDPLGTVRTDPQSETVYVKCGRQIQWDPFRWFNPTFDYANEECMPRWLRNEDVAQWPITGQLDKPAPTTCGCPVNGRNDIPCHICGQMVNVQCWNCKTPRGEGVCPNPKPARTRTEENA